MHCPMVLGKVLRPNLDIPSFQFPIVFILLFQTMAKGEHNAGLDQSTPSVSGYVSHMSPKKTNNKFFKFVLQTSPETCESAICFDESKKCKVKEYYDSGSPVKFLNIKRNTGKKKTY